MENQKNPEEDDNPVKLVPPDNRRCRRTDGKGWRCKNVLNSAYNPSSYCDKHYNSTWYQQKYKRHRIRRRKLVGSSHHQTSHEIGFKRKRVAIPENPDDQLKKCCSAEEEEVRSLEEGEEVETQTCEMKLERILGVCKTKCVELLEELEKKTKECIVIQEKFAELASMTIAAQEELEEFKRRQETKRNLDQMVSGRKEETTCQRVSLLEGELKKMEKDMERERRIAQGEVEFWRNKVFDLEARVLRMENGTVQSHILEPRGLQNDAPGYGEKGGDDEYPDAIFNGGRHCSHVSELKFKVEDEVGECSANSVSSETPKVSCRGQNAENDENGRLERASVNESSSDNHLGLSVKLHAKVGNTAAANSVELVCLSSDDEGAGEASKKSSDCAMPGDVMDRMSMKYKNKVKDMKWEFEADMLSSFEEDPELCMKAVCALYRQQTFEGNSANRLSHHLDSFRIKTLAEFLMEEDCKGDLKKSVKELEAFTPKALDDCKRLASTYSKQLFDIYKDKQYPFIRLASTASH